MDFVILTGLSGAGKTNALHAMEDIGFYCVDNLPPLLLETFYDLCENSTDKRMKKVAVAVDVRSGEMFTEIPDVLSRIRVEGKRFKVLFVDAKPDILLKRYKETRRKHPLLDKMASGTVEDAVKLEYELMKSVKEMADYVIDTTYMGPQQLRERVNIVFAGGSDDSLLVTFMSFGFKHGIPLGADLIFDVRCLQNPFYIKELKPLTGLDEAVREYVMNFDTSKEYLRRVADLLDFTIPLYRQEGKSELVIGIGCTGGRHRSVVMARLLNAHLIENNQRSAIHHRDIWKA